MYVVLLILASRNLVQCSVRVGESLDKAHKSKVEMLSSVFLLRTRNRRKSKENLGKKHELAVRASLSFAPSLSGLLSCGMNEMPTLLQLFY